MMLAQLSNKLQTVGIKKTFHITCDNLIRPFIPSIHNIRWTINRSKILKLGG